MYPGHSDFFGMPAESSNSNKRRKAMSEEEKTAACEGTEAPPLPEINFATFIFSLNSAVLVHLGLVEEPLTGKKEKNLPLAKQTIDILGMLEEKTGGNLSGDEEKLLTNILHDLRMMYVKECK